MRILEMRLRYVALGAAIRTALGLFGFINAAREQPHSGSAQLFSYLSVGFVAGATTGLLQWNLRPLLSRSVPLYYAIWATTVAVAVAIVLLPESVHSGQWWDFVTLTALGAGVGLSLAWTWRYITGENT